MVAFHRRYYFPANIMLAVYGDFSTPDMKARLERLFGTWNATQPSVPPFPAVQASPEPGVFVGNKPDVNQSVFYIGQLGGVLSDKNDPALQIMADILGGGFSSRLFRRVRTNLGYAYGISADWGAAYDHPGLFTIAGSTKSNSTTEAIEVVRQELKKMRTSEVRDSELQTAKSTALNSFIFNFDTPSKTLSRLLRYEYFGYPKDFIFRYQKAVEGVTKADVLRVARRYLRPNDFTIVVVGNPAAFGKPLTALNLPLKPIDLTIPAPATTVAEK
jgi:zinc protease